MSLPVEGIILAPASQGPSGLYANQVNYTPASSQTVDVTNYNSAYITGGSAAVTITPSAAISGKRFMLALASDAAPASFTVFTFASPFIINGGTLTVTAGSYAIIECYCTGTFWYCAVVDTVTP